MFPSVQSARLWLRTGRAAGVENWHEGFISTTHTTAADVWTRRVIVWKVFGSMEVEAMSCKDEWLDAAEMFHEDS